MSKLRVAVAGAGSYAGAACIDLLLSHPRVELAQVSSRTKTGERHCDVFPGSRCELPLLAAVEPSQCDLVISALGHLEAAQLVPSWLEEGAVVIDMSAAFRLETPERFRHWYGEPHPSSGLLHEAVLALPELDPGPLSGASLLALPGCFSTAAILACGPAFAAGMVEPTVIVDGKTGVSGAGRSAGSEYLFAELDQSVRPYAAAGHRHQPEMTQTLSRLSGGEVEVVFVPHLVPMTRGIEVSCYLRPQAGIGLEDLRQCYRQRYAGQPFVRIFEGALASKLTSGTNLCLVQLAAQGDVVIAMAVLDNLGRGAASQAIQVMNLRFGLGVTSGLGASPQWP